MTYCLLSIMFSKLGNPKKQDSNRFSLFDTLRGACVVGMIFYHTVFDIAAVQGNIESNSLLQALTVIRDFGASLFILIAGVCFHFGKNRKKRFLLLFGAGLIVTLATYIVMPDCAVIFGILTFMSVAEPVMLLSDKVCRRIPPFPGFLLSLFLFFLFFRVNYGYIGTYHHCLIYYPSFLYRNYITAFFGFPFNGFVSGDYYSFFPWFFMYLTGYFLWGVLDKHKKHLQKLLRLKLPVLNFCGKYSLYLYLAHQPIIYGLVTLLFCC